MAWVETTSLSFTARHEAAQADDAIAVLEALEEHRDALEELFPRVPGNVTVVLHDSPLQLGLAQPYLPVARRLASPRGRRYMAGWFAAGEVHTLSPAVLRALAAGPDSLERAAAHARSAPTRCSWSGENNPLLPPPFRPGSVPAPAAPRLAGRGSRPVLLGPGAASARRRSRCGCARDGVDFPPGVRATRGILAGALFDLLARERGAAACVRLADRRCRDGSRAMRSRTAFERPRGRACAALARRTSSASHARARRAPVGDLA